MDPCAYFETQDQSHFSVTVQPLGYNFLITSIMGWDNIEGAAFLYYCSRGLALGLDSRGDALELVARFMRDKCKKTEEPRPIEDMKSVFEKNANFRNETGWDVPRTNRVILNLIATKKITWKKFLATLEFNPADEALLKVSTKALSATFFGLTKAYRTIAFLTLLNRPREH